MMPVKRTMRIRAAFIHGKKGGFYQMSLVYYCNNCHQPLEENPRYHWHTADGIVCDDCRWSEYVECCNCGDTVHRDAVRYDGDGDAYCDECASDYSRCDRCGEFYHANRMHARHNGELYCEYCNNSPEGYNYARINSYHERPDELQFLGGNTLGRYYGVELEIDEGGHAEYCAEDMGEVLDQRAWFNRDGSLGDYGFEIITHPATINYHLQEFPWEDVCDIAKKYGYRSHDTDTCGLHVHVSRNGFGATYCEAELTIAKVILLIDRLWDEFVVFSRRDFHKLEEWAKKPDCDMSPFDGEMDIIRKSKRVDRYNAVNLNNRNTVEFRLFRGTLKPETIKATLQMLELLIGFCRRNSVKQMFDCTFKEVMEKSGSYPELLDYLEERELL